MRLVRITYMNRYNRLIRESVSFSDYLLNVKLQKLNQSRISPKVSFTGELQVSFTWGTAGDSYEIALFSET